MQGSAVRNRDHGVDPRRTRRSPALAMLAVALLAGVPPTWAAGQQRVSQTRKVAIVLFEGVELLDFAGPGEDLEER